MTQEGKRDDDEAESGGTERPSEKDASQGDSNKCNCCGRGLLPRHRSLRWTNQTAVVDEPEARRAGKMAPAPASSHSLMSTSGT